MSKKKTSMPETPTFQVDPNVAWSQDRLKDQYGYLMNGLTQEGQSLSGGLGEATNISPEISRLSQQYAQSQLDPAFRTQRQDLINTLEANNQLTGSTTASSLGNLSADYMASLTGMQAQYGLADVSRALNNRMQLYTTGLNIGQNVGQAGLQNQEQMNQFALQNYENQVAAAMMNKNNSSAGMWGSLGGAALGAGAGTLLALPTGGMSIGMGAALGAGLGGSLGGAAFGGSSAGGQMSSGLGMLGGYMAGSKYAPTAYTYTRGPESVTDLSRSYQPLGSYARSQGLL
jgi:hypothetical protein